MPTVNTSSSYEFVVFINDYVINTLSKAINAQPFNITTTVLGMPVSINFTSPVTIGIQNNAIAVNVSVVTTISSFFQYTGKLTAYFAPQFHAGGNGDFVKFRPDILSIDYDEANLTMFGFNANLTIVTNFFTWIVSKIDDYLIPYTSI